MNPSKAAPTDDLKLATGAAGPAVPTLGRLWQWSGLACGQRGPRRLRARLAFLAKAWPLRTTLAPFDNPSQPTALTRALVQRPDMVGAVVWPYINLAWDGRRRLDAIREHFDVVDSLGGLLDFPMAQSVQVLDLGDIQEGLKLVLDQPHWFMREGQLVLNLFAAEQRIYSIAFSLGRTAAGLVAYVGAIQGGNTDGVMADYKDLTKTLHGMRPRDFLVELLRTFCRALGVSQILAVADDHRQHRSSYFGRAKADTLSLNYDEIWTERGGTRESPDFFLLGIESPLKSLDDVPSKKRAMYRRRYELLESLQARIAAAVSPSAVAATAVPAQEGPSP